MELIINKFRNYVNDLVKNYQGQKNSAPCDVYSSLQEFALMVHYGNEILDKCSATYDKKELLILARLLQEISETAFASLIHRDSNKKTEHKPIHESSLDEFRVGEAVYNPNRLNTETDGAQ